MAVYTKVSADEVNNLLKNYDIGSLVELKGISEGVSNTNYYLKTDKNRFIFTVFEGDEDNAELLYSLNLLDYMSAKGVNCPSPIKNIKGNILAQIHNKQCVITSFLDGKSVRIVQNRHCKMLGEKLAGMHLAAQDFDMYRANNSYIENVWNRIFDKISDKIDSIKLGLKDEMQLHYSEICGRLPTNLPSGVIHCDLFPDNAFFLNDKLSGLIDFYYACNDLYIYDIAICINAWCFEPGAQFNLTKTKLLLSSYNKVRPLSDEELEAIPVLCATAALWVLLTRLYDWFNHDEEALVARKDPVEMLQILRFHMQVKNHSEYGI